MQTELRSNKEAGLRVNDITVKKIQSFIFEQKDADEKALYQESNS